MVSKKPCFVVVSSQFACYIEESLSCVLVFVFVPELNFREKLDFYLYIRISLTKHHVGWG